MTKTKFLLLCLLGLGGAAGAAVYVEVARQNSWQSHENATNADFRKGVAEAKADIAKGRNAWYFHFYSNMPSGPDDPVLARERDLFVEMYTAKGIDLMNSASNCIPVPGLHLRAEGYNVVAEPELKRKFGDNFMTLIKEAVARRMKESPNSPN